jgi:hypothetical protein
LQIETDKRHRQARHNRQFKTNRPRFEARIPQ